MGDMGDIFNAMRDRVSLLCIVLARKLTRWGYTDDHLRAAEEQQRAYIANPQ